MNDSPEPRRSAGVAETFGEHFLVEYVACDPAIIARASALQPILESALDACGATRIRSVFHQFEPHGASGIILIAESHLSFHSWPEERYMALDVFTCGAMDATVAIRRIERAIGAGEARVRRFVRGQ